jgi:hypothetical protein
VRGSALPFALWLAPVEVPEPVVPVDDPDAGWPPDWPEPELALCDADDDGDWDCDWVGVEWLGVECFGVVFVEGELPANGSLYCSSPALWAKAAAGTSSSTTQQTARRRPVMRPISSRSIARAAQVAERVSPSRRERRRVDPPAEANASLACSIVRMRRLVLLSLLAALATAPTADARRIVPYGFFGMNGSGALSQSSQGAQEREWASMASSGVEAARALFSWAQMQTGEAGPIDFELSDAIVSRAARRRIRLLALIYGTPRWARLYPDRFQSPPRDNEQFASFAGRLVARYGSQGSFWREHPKLPRRPVVEWQIWNEPNLDFYWNVPIGSPAAWPQGYLRLLKPTTQAIRRGDPNARVVLAGLTNRSWDYLKQLYKLHARPFFDTVGVQTWTSSPRSMLKAFRLVRGLMRRYHDGRKEIWATELGWPAARGRVSQMRPDERSFTTTDGKMAKRLPTIYRYLAMRRTNPLYRVTRVYWYTWASTYQGQDIFSYSGLLRVDPARDLFQARPALRYYRATARRLQGCSKTSTGICKRR